jgi:hypothetical protein
MDKLELRPLSLGELLDRAFTLYRRNFWLFVGIMAIPSSLFIPITFYMFRSLGSPLAMFNPKAQAALFGAVLFAFIILFSLLYFVAQGAATHAVAEAYLGRSSTIRGSYAKMRGRLWRLIGVILNIGIRVMGYMVLSVSVPAFAGTLLMTLLARGNPTFAAVGGIIMVVLVYGGMGVGVWFVLRYSVSIPAMLLEDVTGRAAIRRSIALTRGRRGRLFLAFLLSFVMSYVGMIVFQGPFYIPLFIMGSKGQLPTLPLLFAMSVAGAIGAAVTGPLLMIVLVLCYYDLRIRKEAFDLNFMMTSLEKPEPADSAPPA